MKIAVLGYGDRGRLYAGLFLEQGANICAVCDTDTYKLELAIKDCSLKQSQCFKTEDEFWAAGKIADLLVISTLDQLHYKHTMKAIELNYDILLEKPIAPSLDECKAIENAAK